MINMSDCRDVIWVMYAVGTVLGFLLGMCSVTILSIYFSRKEQKKEGV